jgi:hypothetical protein
MYLYVSSTSQLVLLTYKYMITHSPGLVQANYVLLTCKYMTNHSPGLIGMLGVEAGEWVVMYLYVRGTSQGSGWSCICMLGVQARGVSGHVFVC